MGNKKRLYWNSCSFLDSDDIVGINSKLSNIFNPYYDDITRTDRSYKASIGGSSNESIFRRTFIECSKHPFDFALVSWSHPERYFLTDFTIDIDYHKLKQESDSFFFPTKWSDTHMYGYKSQIPYNKNGSPNHTDVLKLEPKGTDDTIFYTLSLHNLFKQKGIPHLFLNMGKLDSNVLWARESWLQELDPINYLSLNTDDTILQKMQFSFVEHFLNLDNNPLIKDADAINSNKPIMHTLYTSDTAGHLSDFGYKKISKYIYEHIIKNNLV